MAYDTGCRPHELLKLRIKDIVFKYRGHRQYAEIRVNGKPGSRHIPLIDSIPYIKDYLDHEHPQPGNPNAILICGIGRSFGRILDFRSLYKIYNKDYKKLLFQKLLENPNVPLEDKQNIRELLNRYRNKIPYIMAIIGSSALILFYILTRTINIPTIGIQEDVSGTDILTKVMQAAIVGLSLYIVVSLIKRKSQSAVPVIEYEKRQSHAVDKNQKRNKESDFSSYK